MESYCHKAVILLTIYNLLHQSAMGMPMQVPTDLDFSPNGFLQFFLASSTQPSTPAVKHKNSATFAVLTAPTNCPVNQKLVNGNCRTIV
jgi:hypothetical protein